MPTPIDRAMQSRNMFLGFAGIVTAVAAYSIWGGDMFPQQPPPEPKGDPDGWSVEDMRAYLKARGSIVDASETREALLGRIRRVRAAGSA